MSLQQLDKTNFDHTIANGIALVDFYADWCPSCRLLSHVMNEVANERQDVTVGKLNIDSEDELAAKYRVKSIPTLIVFKNGEEKTRLVGAKSKRAILAALS